MMAEGLTLKVPRFVPPLDPDFRPAVLANHTFLTKVRTSGKAVPLVLAFERMHGQISRYETEVFDESDRRSAANLPYAERLVKFLLWQYGAHRVYVGGPATIGAHIRRTYSPEGSRAFDAVFMGETVYDMGFQVVSCSPDEVPGFRENSNRLGGHLDGCRVGFDLGASDIKVSAVVDGKSVYSKEIVWEPRKHSDPLYHYNIITEAVKEAASKMPRLDAIGGSAAGVYVDNSPRVSSLFRSIPEERSDDVRNLFFRIGREMGVPLEVVNDGNVTALVGSMALEDTAVLGIALGSSEAAGYVGHSGTMNDWLNELAFAPIDYSPTAPRDEWSGDQGCGVSYLSQQCVFRLAEKVDIAVPENVTDAEKLKAVQQDLDAGDQGAARIWQTMGYYLGYALAHYADFYSLKHVVLLGRCTSCSGGNLLVEKAEEILRNEFPELGERLDIELPDEEARRVGQSVAAASLPVIQGA